MSNYEIINDIKENSGYSNNEKVTTTNLLKNFKEN